MYKIIGADQKEYGPVTSDQIRQWIADQRANAQTKARAEGEQEWKTLAEFPEFAPALGLSPGATFAPPVPMADSGATRDAALQAVKGPVNALLITAIVGLVAVAGDLILNLLALAGSHVGMRHTGDPQMDRVLQMFGGGGVGIVKDVLGAVCGVIILRAAMKMQKLENHQLAFTASILAMIPCVSPCCFLGLPFGIWALVVLNKPEVKSQFT
jgi:hypothetical protein